MIPLSGIFSRTSKDAASDAQSINADLLVRAGYVSKTMAGVYAYLPLGLRVIRNIERIVRQEMDALGAQEVLLPALSPREFWEKTGRWNPEDFDVLFRLPAANNQEYALNPTHEEIITPTVKPFVRSYRDLPFSAYQIQTKFRNELRARSGILRGREFIMKDLYSFHADQADLERFYEQAQASYHRVFERVGLADRTYVTYASGGTFSQYSHEYQVLLPQGEDTIYVSEEAEKQGKRIAINTEIYQPGVTACPVTGGKTFRQVQASEAGNIFMLGTKFSAPFGLQYTAKDGSVQRVIMGCYGIGISRLMGIVAEAMADENGLVWPAAIAPATVILTPLAKTVEEESFRQAHALGARMAASGIAVLLDDRLDASVGSRLADADLLGIPVRVVVSPNTLAVQQVEVKFRQSGTVRMMTPDACVEHLTQEGGMDHA